MGTRERRMVVADSPAMKISNARNHVGNLLFVDALGFLKYPIWIFPECCEPAGWLRWPDIVGHHASSSVLQCIAAKPDIRCRIGEVFGPPLQIGLAAPPLLAVRQLGKRGLNVALRRVQKGPLGNQSIRCEWWKCEFLLPKFRHDRIESIHK